MLKTAHLRTHSWDILNLSKINFSDILPKSLEVNRVFTYLH